MIMRLDNKKGVALIITLYVLVMLLSFSSIFILRTVNENNLAIREREQAKSFYVAQAGGDAGFDQLDTLINTYLQNTINATNPATLIANTTTYVANGDGIGFLTNFVQNGGAQVLTVNGAQAEFALSDVAFGSGEYDLNIIMTEKVNPAVVTADSWDFSYNYRIESDAISSGSLKDVQLSGDFTIRVQRDNFAKYALFTNEQQLPNGTNVWFTNNTNFAGPIHTNGRYNIYGNPSGTFDGLVEQHEQSTRYYNSGFTVLLDDDHNGANDVPTFNAGFNRDATSVSLSSPAQQQDIIDQSTGGQTFSGNGVYLANNGTALTGGIYVDGNSNISLGVNGSNNAVYTIEQGATTKIVTVDTANNQTNVETVGTGTTVYTGVPDGIDNAGTIIYVAGGVDQLSGTVQQDTQLTISSHDDIVVSNHVRYSNYTAAVGAPGTAGYVAPHADGADNLLGLVTWAGDVRIGTSAPDDVDIHGTILAKSGIFQVDNYTDQGVGGRGVATLLGGVISDNYGAFGLFNGGTGQYLSGYGRNFVYDERMQGGSAPPYFPSLNTFIAFTNDITDKVVWQQGDS